jgi:NAD(P)-dependent dehydrogenase (short-subunit alcohol dehydrogenase family)
MNRGEQMNPDFSEKVVLVAGGTGGLGRSVSLLFLEHGAKVAVTWRRQEEFVALKTAAGDHSTRLFGMQTDVTDTRETRPLVARILSEWNQLDAVVNTVGGYAGGIPLWETTTETFDRMLDLNVRAGFALAHAAIPAMLALGRGTIVNVAAKAAWDHAAGASAYAASKAAALALMDSLAADLKGTGVRVNSVLPSIIDTETNRKAMPDADFAKWPKPEEIARVILFLCGDDAKVIHGAAIPVYGND